MPLYVFECDVCGTIFERENHMNVDLLGVTCTNGHSKTHRIYSLMGLIPRCLRRENQFRYRYPDRLRRVSSFRPSGYLQGVGVLRQ